MLGVIGRRRPELISRLLLTLGALLPYWRFLTFSVIYVTDDRFTSDIFNGELPGRVLIGEMLRHGQLPVWTNQLCSGLPLAIPADPIQLALFSSLSPAPALDVFVIALLLVAAHGAYGLARRWGANRAGAILAGIAFAGSGCIAAQLKHLGIVSTVVWLPVGLLLLDHTLRFDAGRQRPLTRRVLSAGFFGLVFAEQVLCAFPQSAYICALAYAGFGLFRIVADRPSAHSWKLSGALLAMVAGAASLGAIGGAVSLLPLSQLGAISDRAEPLGWNWTNRFAYWPQNLATFFVPYINGDISNNTYVGRSLFWEDYGYVGLATVMLAILCAFAGRRRPNVRFAVWLTFIAYLLVLGPLTPVFYTAYHVLPGLNLFRVPNRFLIVTDMGLAILGGLGLTLVCDDIARRYTRSRWPLVFAVSTCVVTAGDLWFHQPRQNPVVSADAWLAPPASAGIIRDASVTPRVYTPGKYEVHERAFLEGRGWAGDLTPLFRLRDLLEPNAGAGFWDVASADCYAAISPSWFVDVWGDHNRDGLLVRSLVHEDAKAQVLRLDPAFATVMAVYGVTHVVTAYPQTGADLPLVGRTQSSFVYGVPRAARARLVGTGLSVESNSEAASRILDPQFDPSREVLLDDLDVASRGAGAADSGTAAIVRDDPTRVDVDIDAPSAGYLLLADTYYPGWTADVDGAPVPIHRANISLRAVEVPMGHHQVHFLYSAPAATTGLRLTLGATTTLELWVLFALYADRRSRRNLMNPMTPQKPITT